MKPIPKEDIQSLERDILFQVLDFFEQYHITYFTSGGTTLGAVRHEGFIPWDDDIDLYIPRADYNRMLQLATNRTIGKNIRICQGVQYQYALKRTKCAPQRAGHRHIY